MSREAPPKASSAAAAGAYVHGKRRAGPEGPEAVVDIVVTLVTGNASWWKQRKYRREAAHRLRRLRAEGWSLRWLERLPAAGVDTRRRTAYHLARHDLGGHCGGGLGVGAGEGGAGGEGRTLS
ncbi:MAG: hypothetical protein MUD06_01180 [Rhodospirillales bacterium]|jgi:hypothetical protein|nr:hypothetical protein [Rhodospirillales bacterium]